MKLCAYIYCSAPRLIHTRMHHMHTQDGKEKSILDKDKEAQALLEMASKPMHSAWLREPSEDNTEDNSGLTGEERA